MRAADPDGDPDSPDFDEAEAESVRNLLRGTLERDGHEAPDVLRGVQRKIRQRSRGKFYADGWSTAKNPPIATYLLTSLAMLLILGLVYSLFGSLAGDPDRCTTSRPPCTSSSRAQNRRASDSRRTRRAQPCLHSPRPP